MVDPISDAVAALAATDRLVVGCDFDGTLAPIVADPAAARALPGGLEALSELASMPGTEVALISGRARADLIALAGSPRGVRLIGSHGGEWEDGFAGSVTAEQAELLDSVIGQVAEIVADAPGALIETKPGSVAVHVRQADRADAERILAALQQGPASREGVSTIAGKEVLELSVVHASKGSAITLLQQQSNATATAYFGDDTTDETVFSMLTASDAGFKVGPGPTAARLRLPDPADVVTVLAELARLRASR